MSKPSLSHLDMYKTVWSSDGISEIECWNCLEYLDYDKILDAIHEANGIIIQCNCGEEFEVNIGFKISPIYEE